MSTPSATRVAYKHLREARPQESAEQRYHHNLVKAQKSLNNIDKLVRKHISEQARKPNDWGYVGDMAHVAELLEDIETFLR